MVSPTDQFLQAVFAQHPHKSRAIFMGRVLVNHYLMAPINKQAGSFVELSKFFEGFCRNFEIFMHGVAAPRALKVALEEFQAHASHLKNPDLRKYLLLAIGDAYLMVGTSEYRGYDSSTTRQHFVKRFLVVAEQLNVQFGSSGQSLLGELQPQIFKAILSLPPASRRPTQAPAQLLLEKLIAEPWFNAPKPSRTAEEYYKYAIEQLPSRLLTK